MITRLLKYIGLVLLGLLVFYGSLVAFFPLEPAKTVDADTALPSIVFDGYTFHSQTFGNPSDPIVLALHGGPGGDYRSILPLQELSDRYFVVFYDQRMTGLSSRQSDAMFTVQSFYDDMTLFLDHHDIGQPIYIVGHSWGGMLASGYVGLYPERISKIVVIEPGILRHDLADAYFAAAAPQFDVAGILGVSRVWLNKWRVRTNDDPHARDDYFQSEFYLYLKNRGNGPEFEGWRIGSYAMDQTIGRSMRDPEFLETLDFLQGVDQFEGEVLFLTSELNTDYGADYQAGFLGFYQNAEQRIVPGAGHDLWRDQPDVTNRMIAEFLAE